MSGANSAGQKRLPRTLGRRGSPPLGRPVKLGRFHRGVDSVRSAARGFDGTKPRAPSEHDATLRACLTKLRPRRIRNGF